MTTRAETKTQPQPDRLRRLGRQSYIVGSLAFVMIGLLHTFVHLTDLSADQIRDDLQAIGGVEGVDATAWELWSGLSLLMGFFAVAIGLGNLAGLEGRPDRSPAVGVCVVNVATLAAVTAVGYAYLGPIQLIGGPAGMVLFSLPIYARRQAGRVAPTAAPV